MAGDDPRMKFDRDKLKQDFSRAAHTYDAESGLQRAVLESLMEWSGETVPNLHPSARILDVGSGTGYFGQMLETTPCQASLVGCDIAYGMCVKAFENTRYHHMTNATIEHLPFADKLFTLVFSSLTLQWINDPIEALHECFRVTEPEGEILISTFGTQTLKEMRNVFSMLDDDAHVSPFHSALQLQDMVRMVGYSSIESQTRIYRLHTPSFLSLAKHLKAIGATNKRTDRAKRLMSHTQLRKIDEFYHLFYKQPEGLPVTWEVHFLKARKQMV
jgi:malonyl-CoA O-methyltransferase